MTRPESPPPAPASPASLAPPAPPAPPEDMEDLDPGFARQRTELAWVRTALAFTGLGAATLKVVPLAGTLVIAVAAVVWVIGRLARPYGRAGGQARGRLLLLVTVAMVGVSLIALVATFFAGDGLFVVSTG